MLFGRKEPAGPWAVDVLTTEYLVSGEIDEAGQQWAWVYFQAMAPQSPAEPLQVAVSGVRSTGALAVPELTGLRACFALDSNLVALLPRDEAAAAVWDEWNKGDGVPARVLLGPYLLTGTVLAPGGDLGNVMLAGALAVRGATFTRLDAGGDGAALQADRASVLKRHVHAAVQLG